MAVWDAVAKIAGKPLFRLLAERYGCVANPRVFVYASGGYYYPGKNLAALRAEMRSYLNRGYTVVKMKVGGAANAEDRKRIEAVLAEVGNDAQLAVDANGRFDLETAIAYAKMLREYQLFWYEEAGDPLDFALQSAMITSKGAAGVAGAGFVTLAATLASMHHIPVAGLVLLLGVERLTNIARAVVNVIGSSVATIVIAKWEHAFDGERARLCFEGKRRARAT